MTPFSSNTQDSETYSLYAGIRGNESGAQGWNQEKSAHLAQIDGIRLVIEQGEDDRMIVNQCVVSSALNKGSSYAIF